MADHSLPSIYCGISEWIMVATSEDYASKGPSPLARRAFSTDPIELINVLRDKARSESATQSRAGYAALLDWTEAAHALLLENTASNAAVFVQISKTADQELSLVPPLRVLSVFVLRAVKEYVLCSHLLDDLLMDAEDYSLAGLVAVVIEEHPPVVSHLSAAALDRAKHLAHQLPDEQWRQDYLTLLSSGTSEL